MVIIIICCSAVLSGCSG